MPDDLVRLSGFQDDRIQDPRDQEVDGWWQDHEGEGADGHVLHYHHHDRPGYVGEESLELPVSVLHAQADAQGPQRNDQQILSRICSPTL